jgi:hypothetical protein
MKKTVTFLFLIFVLSNHRRLWLRTLRSNDLSTLKVDSLSDTDIAKIQAQLQVIT